MRTKLSHAELAAFRETGRRSFYWYFLYAFGVYFYCQLRKKENDWHDPHVHRDICHYYGDFITWWMRNRDKQEDIYVMVWAIPREGGKSMTITSAGQSWCHLKDPNLMTGIGSYNKDKAKDFLRPIKTMYEGLSKTSMFNDLYGQWQGPEEKWTEGAITHSARTLKDIREPSFHVTGVKGGSTGSRYDIYNLDDPIPDRSQKDLSTQLDSDIQAAVSHLKKAIPVVRKNGLLIIPLTRKADYDVFSYVVNEFKVREFAPTGMRPHPDDYKMDEKNGQCFVYFMSGRDEEGNPTMPKVWPETRLRNFEQRDPVNFASEIMNLPSKGSHMALDQKQIDAMWVRAENIPTNLRWTIHCDTAFKTAEQKAAGDYNAILVAGHAKDGSGDVYIVRVLLSNMWTGEQFYDNLVGVTQDLHARYQSVWCITDEKETGGKEGLSETVMTSHFHAAGMVMPRVIRIPRQGRAKELRMSAAETYWSHGKVRLLQGGENLRILTQQVMRRGYTAHDDAADAAADIFYPQVYRPERRAQGLEFLDGRARRPLDNYIHTPVHLRDVNGKIAAREQMARAKEKAQQSHAGRPWWHQKVEEFK